MRSAPDPLLLSLLRGDEPAAVSGDEWRRAAAAARAEGLEAWLYRRIARGASDVPDDVRDGLRTANAGVKWDSVLTHDFGEYGIPLGMDPDHPDTDAVCLIQSFYGLVVRLAELRGTDVNQPRHLQKVTRTR